jgi:ABC-type lipoprotein export system ATPase subunit/predicted metal-dependent phosphoesterase TrpH
MDMNSIGSIWRKWDLHIHTPASYQWSGKQLNTQSPAEREVTCQTIVDKINSLDIDAFCIMDYWTFEGYIAVRDYLRNRPSATKKKIFPGIELRLEAPTDYRLNTHVLFDDAILPETLGHFLARLCVGGPDGKPPSRQNLVDLGKGYDDGKLKLHGFKPDERVIDDRMYLLGIQTAVITRDSLKNAIDTVGDERCLIIQPYDTSDGLEHLDWKRHPYTDSYLMKMADIFETRHPIAVDLFLGHGHPDKPTLGSEFIQNLGGYPKPVVSGSDAHSIASYGDYPSNRVTWLKAQPTYAGLRQVCNEPSLRCFIGTSPPKLDHIAQNPTKYMRHLQMEKVPASPVTDYWFDGINIDLNPGLIAIIGNKGTGKSALADILALAANAHCPELEFLTDRRFRQGSNISKFFRATLTWADEKFVRVGLDQNPDAGLPERARYLPQQFIEKLCNEIESGGGNFERELKKVIFSHVPEERQLRKASLDELIEYTVGSHRKAISLLQAKLHALNSEILRTENDVSEDTIKSYVMALSLKLAELDAHEKTRPKAVAEPADAGESPAEKQTAEDLALAQRELADLNNRLTPLRTERAALIARAALLERLSGHIDNLESYYGSFVEQAEPEFVEAGLNLHEIARLTINRAPLTMLFSESRARLAQIAVTVNGSAEQKGIEGLAGDVANKIARLQNDLGARQREYQAYLTEQERWQIQRAEIEGTPDKPETIQFLSARIKAAQETLPTILYDLRNQRRQSVRDIHGELLKIRAVYQELYEPVQKMAAESSGFTKEPLHLDFSAFLAPSRFENDFLDYIHRNRIGNFYGDVESKKAVEKLLSPRDFNSTDDVIAFVDDVIAALTSVDRNGVQETVTIQSQMKDPKKLADLYDFLFGLRYLEPRYALKLGKKDISQLSPGEKGALLLVFYLLLDPEQIPIIIDQPEQNLDNESVVKLLVDCIRQARARRQVIIVTHNPNLAVVCDADQVICCYLDKTGGNKVSYESGAIEDNPINRRSVDVLEGTYPAFDNRRRKYHKPSGA